MDFSKEKLKDLIEIYGQIDSFLSYLQKEIENVDKE